MRNLPRSDMDEAYVKRLMDWAARAPISEIEIVDGDFRLHLVKAQGDATIPASQPSEGSDVTSADTDLVVIAPLPGVFYLQATPDAPAYAAVGQPIRAGDTVGLIEAMKMFNPVGSEFDGVVEEILVKSGEEVAAGQPILRLKPEEGSR